MSASVCPRINTTTPPLSRCSSLTKAKEGPEGTVSRTGPHSHHTGSGDGSVVEHRTRDRKVACSSPGRRTGEISAPGLTFCALIFVSVQSRVTAVARQRLRSFCQMCR